jgi:hypothetical protein
MMALPRSGGALLTSIRTSTSPGFDAVTLVGRSRLSRRMSVWLPARQIAVNCSMPTTRALMLHEVQDLPADRVDAALRRLLGDVLDDDALADARRRVDQSLWLAPTLRRYLPDGRRATSAELAAAWAEMVSGRCAEHYELLRALSRLHRLAVPVLKAIAGGQGPYAGLDEHDRAAVTVFRALSALESNATIQRVGPRRWRLNDPTLASMLASSERPARCHRPPAGY